ncbi:MAG TPA: hypothetical protein VFZ65_15215 [Planctomycetota bacterium]|nr:hypothetical protein [Planctomycetota bacterium]
MCRHRIWIVATTMGALLRAQQPTAPPQQPLRSLDDPAVPYRTPRSGEGVRGTVFGWPIDIAARDRRSVAVWQIGVDAAFDADDSESVPFGSLYFWERPDQESLLRATLAVIYDQVTWVQTDAHGSDLIVTFENYTPPWTSGELVDGVVADGEKIYWGYVRAGIGVGSRRQVGPQNDNMFAGDVLFEPGVLYFARGDRTDAAYQVPDSTPELRLRGIVRYDDIERNLLELAHEGLAFGADAVLGHRVQSEPWGLPGTELHDGNQTYAEVTAYAFGITGVPGLLAVGQERNRVYASVHGGLGDGLDRYSAQRVGGGPDLRGTEYETTARPWLPGAAFSEFYPEHYLIGSLGYRRELAFFAHLDLGATIAWLDRDRPTATGRERSDDTLTALSVRLASGFVGRTQLQVGYAHNFDVVRDGERGGDELSVMLTGRF